MFMEFMQDLTQNRLILIVDTDLDVEDIPLDVSTWEKPAINSKFMIYKGKPNFSEEEIDLERQLNLDLEINKTYFIAPLEDMSTLRREETTFQSLDSLLLKEHLLRGKEPKYVSELSESQREFSSNSLSQFNESQADLIKQVIKIREGFFLLQGPPGTGKTETICGILSGLSLRRDKILVCAPSNTACLLYTSPSPRDS